MSKLISHDPRLERTRQKCSINNQMLPSKLTYFILDGSMGCITPFINLFYVSNGLTSAQAGLINGIGNCFALIISPIWGAITDSTKHRKRLCIFFCLAYCISTFLKPLVTNMVSVKQKRITCTHNGNTTSSIQFKPVQTSSRTCVTSYVTTNVDDLFYAAVAIGIVASVFYNGILTYCEGTIIKVVYTREKETSYGAQKLFSPIGFAVGNFITGHVVNNIHTLIISKYTAAFYVFLPYSIILIPLLYKVTCQIKPRHVQDDDLEEGNCLRDFITVFKNPDNLMFLLSVIVSGLCFNAYTGYFFLFMKEELKLSESLMTIPVVVAMTSELLIYPISSNIIQFFGSPIWVVIIGIFSYFPRLLFLSYSKSVWSLLPFQLLHGVGMSLSWAAQIDHSYHIFPVETTTTTVGLMTSFHFIGASVISDILGGYLYHKYGGRIMYRCVACLGGLWALVMLLYFGIRYKLVKRGAKPFQYDYRLVRRRSEY